MSEPIQPRVGGAPGAPRRPAILVVDDDPIALYTLRETLADLDAEVVVAPSGADALRHVLQREFALIFLDVRMPDMDGYEVASVIRQREKSRRIPLIFLTAIAPEQANVFRGYEAGAVDYVFKPLDPHVLRSKASVFIELYRQGDEIRRQMELEHRLIEENFRYRAAALEAERQLRSSEARQALVLRALPISLYEAEPPGHGPREFIDENVARLLGFSAAEFRNQPSLWIERVHPDDLASVLESQNGREENAVEYRWRCADDSYRHLMDYSVTVGDADGGTPRVFGAIVDLHDRRMLEQQLLHAQKLEAIGKLTGGIAHDFNNMLTVVIANLDRVLRREEVAPTTAKRIGFALQGALRCADLTQRLLGFARNQPLVPVPLSLNAVVQGLTELVDRTFAKDIAIKFDLADGLWPVLADEAQMESALMNLLVNARDAMPEGGTVTVRTFNVCAAEDPGVGQDRVAIEVADTGVGMPEEIRLRAVEPFFTTKEAGQGTGLGLSTIYGFVKESGGELVIESEVGRGTTVRLLMPRSALLPRRASAANDAVVPTAEQRTVLLVEDDVEVRRTTAAMLRDIGYEVIEATLAEEALRELNGNGPVDVLLTDLMLPGKLNGYELGQQAVRTRPDLRVLYTSGYAGGIFDQAAATQPLLKKPFRDYELADAIGRVLAEPALASGGGRSAAG